MRNGKSLNFSEDGKCWFSCFIALVSMYPSDLCSRAIGFPGEAQVTSLMDHIPAYSLSVHCV